jgi:hypothetical protein
VEQYLLWIGLFVVATNKTTLYVTSESQLTCNLNVFVANQSLEWCSMNTWATFEKKMISYHNIRVDIFDDKVTDIINCAGSVELEGLYWRI